MRTGEEAVIPRKESIIYELWEFCVYEHQKDKILSSQMTEIYKTALRFKQNMHHYPTKAGYTHTATSVVRRPYDSYRIVEYKVQC
jgi:hypothetical protein